ncbi:hypothetical protein [Ruegeria faecimaris]|nr:hypothetical protein [Ruegeria faecimaris]
MFDISPPETVREDCIAVGMLGAPSLAVLIMLFPFSASGHALIGPE